ncbi:transcriptional attenuator, LytR family [Jatrophihabitans endophyticus]|uniref:Transcriptional attenuator, LytR family n=1 Tax=Jatrophihabitans endophyticus TaxID=1206085 RepID=A0A1M5RKA4_9ACTN|nr:LCP family protein [Jatrophihabitans endophyticus]SHH26569.1 transcriptional attenuator, LytR family [Jatrophihabitans endophyticus]
MTAPAARRRPGPRLAGMPWGMRVGVRAFFASVSLVVLVASGIAWATFQNFTDDIPHGAPVPGASGDHDGAQQNILLIGNDTRAGATRAELDALHTGHDTTTVNADTMMVLHVPGDGEGRPTLVSFPRDAWVTIPGHGRGKLNSAYPDAYNAARSAGRGETAAESAGILATVKTIQTLIGVKIDHYMQVNLLGFYRISEAIGGVEVCLKNAQNKTTETDGTRRGFSGIDLPKGVSVIEGKQALAFVRQRHGLPHGDLDRVKRQQYFLKAAFTKITSAGTLLNPFKMRDLLKAIGSSLLTDPDLDLLGLARQFQSLTAGKIDFATIPNNGPKLIYPDGVETSIIEVNRKALPAFLAQLEGKNDDALARAKAAAPRSVTVDVLNGTETPRLAARNATGLTRLGFRVDTVDSASKTAKTTVQYPPGREAQAKAVLAAVPKAKAVATPDVTRVTLVVGGNGVMVKGVARPADTRPTGSATASGSTSGDRATDSDTDALTCID